MNDITDTAALFIDDFPQMSQGEMRELIYSIQNVIPEEIVSRFDALVHIQGMIQWEMGDLTNQIWKYVQDANLPRSFLDVCHFVSIRFLKRQRSYNTVKAWALTARHYSQSEREKFHFQDLPFSHFSYAAKNRFGAAAHRDILEYSYSKSLGQGYDITVSDLEKEFEGKIRPGLVRQSEEMDLDDLASEFVDALQALTALAEKLSGSPQILSLIKQGLSLIRMAVEKIQNEVVD